MKEDFMRRVIGTIAAATLAFSIITPLATAQQGSSSQQATTDPASSPDQELGRRFPGKADFIERFADDFKAPYGLAYKDGFVLVADQDGIWRVPHVAGALRAGRPDQPKITDVPPEERKPVPAAYGQEMITQKGVFGVV